MTQLTLDSAAVDIDSDDYRKGFSAGFVASRGAPAPTNVSTPEMAGWLDGYRGCQVPNWRLRNPMNDDSRKTPLGQDSGL